MSKVILREHFHRGIVLCWRNARKLLKLSDEAYRKECYHASYLLGLASMEEIGKAAIILNHWHEDFITYKQYKKELLNHKKKITEAERLEPLNLVEVFGLAPREAIIDSGMIREPDHKAINNMINLRTGSMYVDYNFDENYWSVPSKEMKKQASEILTKAYFSRRYLHNELRHRGIRLRKKKSPAG